MNETLPLDLDLVMQDSLLQQAILAVSQGHYDMFSHATSQASALRRQQSRQKAIQSLRLRLEIGLDTDDDLFAANVLLCMLEGMIDPSETQSDEQCSASICHLKGGYAILRSNAPIHMLTASGFQAHLLSVFTTMDLVHALLIGDRPYFEPLIWHMFSDIQAWWGRLSSWDRFLDLLKVFSEMACLGNLTSHLPPEEGMRLVEKCIPSIESVLDAQAHELPMCAAKDSASLNWQTFCSLYEISASIYLHRALRLRSVDDEVVQAATRRGVEKLLDEALPGMMAHCVIFPILIIGAHCVHSQDRRAIAQALSPSISYLSFGNLALMERLLKDIWSKTDVQANWWDTFEPVAKRVFLF